MKIMIFADMEGISGIYLNSQVEPTGTRYQDARGRMTRDVNACIEGCFNGGAKQVVVRDVHCLCNNLLWDEIDARAECYLGIPGAMRFDGIDGCDGLILLGYHAMAGTQGAILEHTSSRTWQNCWLNGRKAGEVALDAARAGEHDVPVLMVSGDDKLCAEAQAWLGDVVTVQVKQGIHRESGRMLSATVAEEAIRNGAAAAVRRCRGFHPLRLSSPVSVRVEFAEAMRNLTIQPGCASIDGRTLESTADSAEMAINRFV